MVVVALVLAAFAPASAQAPPNLPGLGSAQPETPEQKRAFCLRVGSAALRCGTGLDVPALATCLIRTLPPQDSLRVATLANTARGNFGALLAECGVGR